MNTEPGATPQGRVSFERLRERTDELELLISGLTMLALFALPGWLLEQFETLHLKFPLLLLAVLQMALPLVIAVTYTLAVCFMLHLGLRAYWVGLVGLRAAFPQGIRWDHTRGMGPITRERLRQRLPSIESSIERVDRMASVLFAVISLAALTLLWLGVVASVVFVSGVLIGGALGATNAWLNEVMFAFLMVLIGAPVLLWILDAQLASRSARLRGSPLFRAIVASLGWLVRVMFPARLIAPVRLTVQTNTYPVLFVVLFVVLVLVVPTLGLRSFSAALSFDTFGTQRFIATSDLEAGMRSRHYESLRGDHDRMQPVPMIPEPIVEAAWLSLFLPYWPLRDDPVLEQRCPEHAARSATAGEGSGAEPPRAAWDSAICLRRLWAITLNGKPVELSAFTTSERRDLDLRGLLGFVDLRGLEPGQQLLEITWRPDPTREQLLDDYVPEHIRFTIPFVWSPEHAGGPSTATARQ